MSTTLLQEQIDYYRARASEYDEWFYRQGRYDHGDENTQWFAEVEVIQQALHALSSQDRILELACGTGIWTQELVKLGTHITALDASPEMININRAKVQSDKVTYQQADLFAWQPTQTYDMVFFSFWLSHVPSEKLYSFLEMVSTALKPKGILFLIDSRRVASSTAKDHHIPDEGTSLTRRLNDGREYQIVKIFYEPTTLESHLAEAGISGQVNQTDNYFIHAQGHKRT